MATIGAEYRMDPLSLLDEPWWRVLWRFYHATEREQRHSLRRRMERVDSGTLTALAFNDPSKINDERQAVADAIRAFEHPTKTVDVDSIRARAEAMVARMTAGKVLSPAALAS